MLDWKTERANELFAAVEESKILAQNFKRLSQEFAEIATELESGGECKPISATNRATEIRELIAKRNKVQKNLKECIRDLAPDLKKAGVITDKA